MNTNYTSTILVNQNPATAFNTIKNFRAWWSEEIEGNTDQLNEDFFYHYKDIHLCKIKLIEMVPNKKLVYQVLDNEFNFVKDKSEWVNTKLIFEISEEGNKTKVLFTHEGLVPEYECYNVCNDAWTGYIQKSLFNLISTGKGEPNPKDGEGFNAELVEKWKLSSKDSKKETQNYTSSFEVNKSPKEVYENINAVTKWWTVNLEGNTQKVNDEFTVTFFKDVHISTQKITELIPDKKIVWLVTNSNLNFIKKRDEWTNTQIVFDIIPIGNKTKVQLTHIGLTPKIECFTDCSKGWEYYFNGSLQKLLSEGKGNPELK